MRRNSRFEFNKLNAKRTYNALVGAKMRTDLRGFWQWKRCGIRYRRMKFRELRCDCSRKADNIYTSADCFHFGREKGCGARGNYENIRLGKYRRKYHRGASMLREKKLTVLITKAYTCYLSHTVDNNYYLVLIIRVLHTQYDGKIIYYKDDHFLLILYYLL